MPTEMFVFINEISISDSYYIILDMLI